MTLAREDITGLVLAGGQGSRMGGIDKGLVTLCGQTLAEHAIARLSPQVDSVLISANRNQDRYAATGLTVLADQLAGFPGPLAGVLAGLRACRTPFLATAPCDTPAFPLDLVERLGDALQAQHADIAMAATREPQGLVRQPVFCLLKRQLADDLAAFLAGGDRKIDRWTARHPLAMVEFADAAAFANANTAQELDSIADRQRQA